MAAFSANQTCQQFSMIKNLSVAPPIGLVADANATEDISFELDSRITLYFFCIPSNICYTANSSDQTLTDGAIHRHGS